MGAYILNDQAEIEKNIDIRLQPVPAPQGAGHAEGRHPVRRRAADAGHRPGPDGQPQDPCSWTSPPWVWPRWLVDQIFEIIKELNARGTTILLVEQNALIALGHRPPGLCAADRQHRPHRHRREPQGQRHGQEGLPGRVEKALFREPQDSRGVRKRAPRLFHGDFVRMPACRREAVAPACRRNGPTISAGNPGPEAPLFDQSRLAATASG